MRLDISTFDPMKCATVAECDSAIDAVIEALRKINEQLLEAKANAAGRGVYADGTWFAKTEGARRVHGQVHQKLQRRRSELVRQERAERHAKHIKGDWAFREVVRENVDSVTFGAWVAEAERRVAKGAE